MAFRNKPQLLTSLVKVPKQEGVSRFVNLLEQEIGGQGTYLESFNPPGNIVGLASGVAKTVRQLNVPAGDWDMMGVMCFNIPGTTTITRLSGGVSIANNFLESAPNNFTIFFPAFMPPSDMSFVCPNMQFTLTTLTPLYLVALANFSGGTLGAYGIIRARQMG
jgi:hypothetical protein